MRVRDVDLAHPPRSYAMLLVRLAIACFVPFAPVYLLVAVTGIMVGLDPLLVGMLRLAFTASVSMTIHELVHACLLSWRNPDMRVSISTDWLRMMVYRKAPLPILQALACAVLGPCAGVMTAMVARIRIFPPSGGHSDDWRYRFSLRASWMAGRPSPRRTDGRDAHECRRHPPCHRRDDMRRARKSIKTIANAIVIRPQHHTVRNSIR